MRPAIHPGRSTSTSLNGKATTFRGNSTTSTQSVDGFLSGRSYEARIESAVAKEPGRSDGSVCCAAPAVGMVMIHSAPAASRPNKRRVLKEPALAANSVRG